MAVDRLSLKHGALPLGLLLALCAGLAVRPAPAQSADPGPPTRLEVDPNAIEDPALPMRIVVGGIPQGQPAHLRVLQDCDGEPGPDLQGKGECVSPLAERDSVKADSDLVVEDWLRFQDLDRDLRKAGKPPLPRQKDLWLYASRQGSKQGRLVLFRLLEKKDACSMWDTIADFFGGPCEFGLLQAMRGEDLGAPSARPEPLFEVRRMDVRADPAKVDPVARTRGATGVSWADAETLLVTIGNTAGHGEALAAGLWQISLRQGREPRLLWRQPPGEARQAVAPLLLPGGRVAFVRQSPGDEAAVGEEPAAVLSVWQAGQLDPAKGALLPYKIHQLLASDARGELVLALSLGAGANHPTLLKTDLSRGTFEYLGFHPALYQAALRAPGGEDSVVSFEDNSGQNGWDLALVDGKGKLLKDLQMRREDDFLPAWRPGGREVAFLAEVETQEEPNQGQAAPGPVLAQQDAAGAVRSSQQAFRDPEAFPGLLALLQAIPQRWEGIRKPLVPVSGRSLEAVLAASTPEERETADRWILELAHVPAAEERARIAAEIARRSVRGSIHEVDLWQPASLFERIQTTDRELAARAVAAWLSWAEALGRRDVLLFAAGRGIDFARFRLPASQILPAAETWAGLTGARSERGRGVIQTSLAALLFAQGRNAEALAAYQKARSLFSSVNDPLGQGNTFKGEAAVYFRLGDNQKALGAYRNARDRFHDGSLLDPNSLGLGSTFQGEADVLFRLGKNQQALAAYKKARGLFEISRSKLGQGHTFQGEGDVLFRLGKNREALAAYRQSRDLFQQSGDPAEQGSSFRGEADVLFQLGETRQALAFYRKSRSFFQSIGDLVGQGNSFRGEADVLFQLGETGQALLSYRNARDLFQAAGDQDGLGNTFKGEADVLFRLGDNQGALDVYRKARDLFQAGGSQLGLGNTWKGEADVLFLLNLNEPQEALADYRKARRFFQAMDDPLGQGNTWLRETQVLVKLRQWAEARQAATEAIKEYQAAERVDGQISAFLRKAQAEEGAGDQAAAADSAAEAIRLHATRRTLRIAERQRIETDETISVAYDILVPLHAGRAGEEGEALRLAEEARSRVLLDLLAGGPVHEEQNVQAPFLAESDRLARELWSLESRIARERDPAGRRGLESERRLRLQEMEWNRYERLASLPEPLPQTNPLKTAEIQRLARESGPILLYYAARSEVWGFLVLPDTSEIRVRKIDLPWDRLGEQVRSFAYHLANPISEARAHREARALWDLLIAPFAGALPAHRPWVLIPHGPLHELPFEALLDPEGKALFERWPVSVSPSSSTLAQALHRQGANQVNGLFAAFASGRGLSLPEREIDDVAELLGAEKALYHSTEAQLETYQEIADKARFLLITTNGVHVEGSRTESYLEIQPTPEAHDSRLTAAEIAAIPMRTELVTLAACDTARGAALLSDERIDLTRAFLIAGAGAVLATRWKVPEDAATSHFLADFYQAYSHGGPEGRRMRKDEALSEARRRSRDRDDPAQVWAAWVLVGDGR